VGGGGLDHTAQLMGSLGGFEPHARTKKMCKGCLLLYYACDDTINEASGA
jgi:hypothetical protein